jgi:hypothetical protein
MYRRLYFAFIYKFVIQSEGPLNLCCSVNNKFPVNSWVSTEESKGLQSMFMHFSANSEMYVHYIAIPSLPLLIKKVSR